LKNKEKDIMGLGTNATPTKRRRKIGIVKENKEQKGSVWIPLIC